MNAYYDQEMTDDMTQVVTQDGNHSDDENQSNICKKKYHIQTASKQARWPSNVMHWTAARSWCSWSPTSIVMVQYNGIQAAWNKSH